MYTLLILINNINFKVMAKQIKTLNATSGYRGGSRAASIASGGKVGRGGKFITRRQRYGDVRKAFGLSSG